MRVSIGGEEGYGYMMPVLEKRGELYILPDYPTGLSLAELKRRYHLQDRFLVLSKS